MVPTSAPHRRECDMATRWLFDSALPFWIEHGVDEHGFAYEELTFEGLPKDVGYWRSLVQFRQTYVFARAAILGIGPKELPGEVFHRAASAFWHPNRGFVHKLDARGLQADSPRECYDQAFGMLACAWAYAVDGKSATLNYAYKTLSFLDDTMAHPHGGYEEASTPRMPRRHNPHMHLLEAFLALYEVSGDDLFIERAAVIVDLFQSHFMDAGGGLREYFDAHWRPAPHANGKIVEPGHHFEWVWLLHEYARLTSTPVNPRASHLFSFAANHGFDSRGRPVEQVDTSGVHLRTSVKLWAITERLKAHIVRAEAAGLAFDPAIAEMVRDMDENFLLHDPPVWFEEFAEDGTPSRRRMPASTLYHITLAMAELLRWQSGSSSALTEAASRQSGSRGRLP